MAATNKRGVFSLEAVLERQTDNTWSNIFDPFRYIMDVTNSVGTNFGYYGGGCGNGSNQRSWVDRIDFDNDTGTSSPRGNLSHEYEAGGGSSSTSHGYFAGGVPDRTHVDRIDYANDGLLRDITTEDTIDQVSTRGYALGYIGGGLQLIFAFVIVLFGPDLLGIDTGLATRIAIATAGIWWAGFSYFSFSRITVEESPKDLEPGVTYFNAGWNSVRNTLKKVRKFPQLLTFLIAYMFYWDGAQTIINMAGVFSVSVLKLTTQDVLIVFVIVQFVAFLGAVIAGRVAKSIGPKKTVLGCIVLFFLAGNGGAFLPEQQLLPVIGLGTIIGLGMGGIQALSRSMYAMMIPDNAQSEFMGFFSVISKFAAMWGPLIYAGVSQSTGSGRNSLQVISIVFVIGFILLTRTDPETLRITPEEWEAS